MYSKAALTLILLAMIAIAVKLWLPAKPVVDPHKPSETEVALMQRVHGLDLRGLTREEAVAAIQQRSVATLVIDWASLAGEFNPESQYRAGKLDVYTGDTTLATALKVALGETTSFQVSGNAIKVVGPEQLAAEEMTVRGYDIADLASDKFWKVSTPAGQEAAVQAARMNQLREVVTQHTEANGWHINYIGSGLPGGNASISVYGTCLVVTQTTDGHWAVARVLEELRHPVGAQH